MSKPVRAGDTPVKVELKEGKPIYWCACGKSSNQPFCDGSHRDTDFKPLKYVPKKDETRSICMCKETSNAPFCDGTHRKK
jgi:CDGSH-type Zn-finger protein